MANRPMLLTFAELGAVLRISRPTLTNMLDRGIITGYRVGVGSSLRFDLAEVMAILKTRPPEEDPPYGLDAHRALLEKGKLTLEQIDEAITAKRLSVVQAESLKKMLVK